MVWACGGVSYTELRQMDLREYAECLAAKKLWDTEWRPAAQKPNGQGR